MDCLRFGVSDNGAQYTLGGFPSFCKYYAVENITTPQLHETSNDQA